MFRKRNNLLSPMARPALLIQWDLLIISSVRPGSLFSFKPHVDSFNSVRFDITTRTRFLSYRYHPNPTFAAIAIDISNELDGGASSKGCKEAVASSVDVGNIMYGNVDGGHGAGHSCCLVGR
jgi:hypothetical protein